jgi:hypothetical protein
MYQFTAIWLVEEDLAEPLVAQRLLRALTGDPQGPPTHWGETASFRRRFSESDVRNFIDNLKQEDGAVPCLRRLTSPAYVLTWTTGHEVRPQLLWLESHNALRPDELAGLFSLADRLTALYQVEIGSVDLRDPKGDRDQYLVRSGRGYHVGTYNDQGPDALFARTYFGPRLLGLANTAEEGGRTLRDLPTVGSCARLDLLSEPWSRSPEALKAAQQHWWSRLALTGILALGVYPSPGARWERPAYAAWPR